MIDSHISWREEEEEEAGEEAPLSMPYQTRLDWVEGSWYLWLCINHPRFSLWVEWNVCACVRTLGDTSIIAITVCLPNDLSIMSDENPKQTIFRPCLRRRTGLCFPAVLCHVLDNLIDPNKQSKRNYSTRIFFSEEDLEVLCCEFDFHLIGKIVPSCPIYLIL